MCASSAAAAPVVQRPPTDRNYVNRQSIVVPTLLLLRWYVNAYKKSAARTFAGVDTELTKQLLCFQEVTEPLSVYLQ